MSSKITIQAILAQMRIGSETMRDWEGKNGPAPRGSVRLAAQGIDLVKRVAYRTGSLVVCMMHDLESRKPLYYGVSHEGSGMQVAWFDIRRGAGTKAVAIAFAERAVPVMARVLDDTLLDAAREAAFEELHQMSKADSKKT